MIQYFWPTDRHSKSRYSFNLKRVRVREKSKIPRSHSTLELFAKLVRKYPVWQLDSGKLQAAPVQVLWSRYIIFFGSRSSPDLGEPLHYLLWLQLQSRFCEAVTFFLLWLQLESRSCGAVTFFALAPGAVQILGSRYIFRVGSNFNPGLEEPLHFLLWLQLESRSWGAVTFFCFGSRSRAAPGTFALRLLSYSEMPICYEKNFNLAYFWTRIQWKNLIGSNSTFWLFLIWILFTMGYSTIVLYITK